jgi:hypothetical protein
VIKTSNQSFLNVYTPVYVRDHPASVDMMPPAVWFPYTADR